MNHRAERARDFGAAIDLNLAGNDPGEVPTRPDAESSMR